MLAARKHFINIITVTLNAGSIVLRNAAQLLSLIHIYFERKVAEGILNY